MRLAGPVRYVRRLSLMLGLCAFATAPALADFALDSQCRSYAGVTTGQARACSYALTRSGIMSCLAAHARDFRPTASTCITAAQDHYDAASSLQGQEADLELGMASTDLLAAAVAN